MADTSAARRLTTELMAMLGREPRRGGHHATAIAAIDDQMPAPRVWRSDMYCADLGQTSLGVEWPAGAIMTVIGRVEQQHVGSLVERDLDERVGFHVEQEMQMVHGTTPLACRLGR